MIAVDSKNAAQPAVEDSGLERLQAALNRYCLALTGSVWDAEDLAQETWAKALGSLRIAAHANPEALLLRIARNTWTDQARRSNILTKILQQEQLRQRELRSDENSLGLEEIFQALLKHLTPLQRTVFLLRDALGYSTGETAGLLRTTAGAVKAALHRARGLLHDIRSELEQGVLPCPEEEGMKALLLAIAAAYQSGDIGLLVALALSDAIEPASAVTLVQTRAVKQPFPLHGTRTGRTGSAGSSLQMAA
ncbi:MAG: hypothetical protein K0R57_4178 [Paenibacillaceae bacterium]|jgi:RNA polymerase sigma-70 factor (ECF subfamily)|nr:hypothetical protein [Paenibacillaceae bacterium]